MNIIYAQQIDDDIYCLVNCEGELVDENGEFTRNIVLKHGKASESGYLVYPL